MISGGIGSCGRSMEIAEDEELTKENGTSANVRLAACTRPPKRLAHTASLAGPFDVLRFATDQWGISSCGMSMEVAEER